MIDKIKKNYLAVGAFATSLLVGSSVAFAAETDTGVAQIITDATAGVLADSKGVIAAALSIGVIFFGAKLLWSKFKSMSK